MMSDVALAVTGGSIAGLLISAWRSIHALNELCAVIREKRPDVWAAHSDKARARGAKPVAAYTGTWIAWLVWGIAKLDATDDSYRQLLSKARWRLLYCLAWFLAVLGAVVWGTM